jgi:tRNA U34 5-methylaminomethyl-2-thiouridine-forming methyltransferase MnmC
MKRIVELTADGSPTISIPDMKVTYHSKHGAVQESLHVFINSGLNSILEKFPKDVISVFEMGFGTGLNALLTMQVAEQRKTNIYYSAVEKFPLVKEEYEQLDYGAKAELMKLHETGWETDVELTELFTLHKTQCALAEVKTTRKFHLIYFDAFAPSAQPELWTKEIFELMYSLLVDEGILVTYCSKGDVRRAMLAAGFKVEKLQGPPGKREMLRAVRLNS